MISKICVISDRGICRKKIRKSWIKAHIREADMRTRPAGLRSVPAWIKALKATLIKSTLIDDLLILLRKHRIKATLTALAHSRLN
jgi:hypothetical protein